MKGRKLKRTHAEIKKNHGGPGPLCLNVIITRYSRFPQTWYSSFEKLSHLKTDRNIHVFKLAPHRIHAITSECIYRWTLPRYDNGNLLFGNQKKTLDMYRESGVTLDMCRMLVTTRICSLWFCTRCPRINLKNRWRRRRIRYIHYTLNSGIYIRRGKLSPLPLDLENMDIYLQKIVGIRRRYAKIN